MYEKNIKEGQALKVLRICHSIMYKEGGGIYSPMLYFGEYTVNKCASPDLGKNGVNFFPRYGGPPFLATRENMAL